MPNTWVLVNICMALEIDGAEVRSYGDLGNDALHGSKSKFLYILLSSLSRGRRCIAIFFRASARGADDILFGFEPLRALLERLVIVITHRQNTPKDL